MVTPEETLEELGRTEGHLGSCIVDCDSGEMLASAGCNFNLEVAAAAHVEVVRAKDRAMRCLGLDERIEDILISLETQYHLIRVVAERPSLFLFVMLDRGRANLAMARHRLAKAEEGMDLDALAEEGWGGFQQRSGHLQLVQG